MFTNSGMVQFKDIFTGREPAPHPPRATTAQKCVRAGGKHNDLENVGYTARHHTFFEMLGNFSFGDYFKERAIELAWKLVTDTFGLPKERLLVTVFSEDEEATVLWKKIAGLGSDSLIRIDTSDNFWSMGDTGPCGPCSEIFFDHGPGVKGGKPGSPDQDGDRYTEIWNLVFMQFEQQADGRRVGLPKPSIDTGMGLERIAAVLQGKQDNYDIDLMRALIEASAQLTHTDPDGPHRVSHRIIADHLRASAFLIADGVLPSNEGRGYVLRRIMRRAMRHAHRLGSHDPLMWRLVPALLAQMGTAYPELMRAQALIEESLKLEESRFQQTLDRGLRLLTEETSRLGAGQKLSGEIAFKLYDTFGFPLDLTQDILRGEGRSVDEAGFARAMENQRALARKAWVGSGDTAVETIWLDLRQRLSATEFLGYSTETAEGQVLALLRDGAEVRSVAAGDEVMVVVNQTPFYGEAGGQQGDRGTISTAAGGLIEVSDVQRKAGDLFVHHGRVREGSIKVGDAVHLSVDGERRAGLRAHHSATHLLHEALRRTLGPHVVQKGSLVAPDRLRFDIAQPRPIAAAELAGIEQDVNRRIRANEPVETRLMSPQDAIAAGAMALFGEKYGEEVRVVSMGGRRASEDKVFSTELCGGTHVARTGDIGLFKIVSEGAVGAGLRRIEAVAGAAAERYVAEQQALLRQAAQQIKVVPAELPQRLEILLEERKRLEHDIAELRRRLTSGASGAAVKDVAGIKFLAQEVADVPARELKAMADRLKDQVGSGIVALIGREGKRASVVVGVTKDLTSRFNAVELARLASHALGGQGGGGRPDMAQGGGSEGAAAPQALAAIEQAIAQVPA
jgi:alanyl-tRNA synthetase